MDLRTVLKALLPSFLPLIVFVAVESLFGEAAGLAAGLVMGGGEFLYVLIREKRVDPFVIVDTAFLGIAGALSLALHDEIFFKLKPVIIEAVMGGALGLALFLPPEYLKKYMENQLKGLRFGDESMPAMRRSLAIMVGVLVAHTLLTLAAAIWWSTAAWGFVSGGLLYILFGAVVLWQFARARWLPRLRRGKTGLGRDEIPAGVSVEMLPIVDDEGKIVGKLPRSECHKTPGRLHPVVHLHILDGKGGIYLQKRATTKDTEPGKWDTAVAGHIAWGETLEAALGRELREELGVTTMAIEAAGGKIEPAFRYRIDTPAESELVHVFVTTYSGELFPDGVEVETGRFWKVPEVFAARGTGLFAPSFEHDLGLMAGAATAEVAATGASSSGNSGTAEVTDRETAAREAAARMAAKAIASGTRKALYSAPDRPL